MVILLGLLVVPATGWGPGGPALAIASTGDQQADEGTSTATMIQRHGRAEVLTLETMTLFGGPTLGPVVATQGEGHSAVPEASVGQDHMHAASTRVVVDDQRVRATARIAEAEVTLPTGQTLSLEGLDTVSQATCQGVQARTAVGQVRLDDQVLLDAASPGPDTRVSLPGGIVLVLNGTERLGETGIRTTGAWLTTTVPTVWTAVTLTETLAVLEPEVCA